MKVVIPGGTGQVGTILDRALTAQGHDVVVLTRSPRGDRQVYWDGKTLGDWAAKLDGSDVVINLAGRSVSCRYTEDNLAAMMTTRCGMPRPSIWPRGAATLHHRSTASKGSQNGGESVAVPVHGCSAGRGSCRCRSVIGNADVVRAEHPGAGARQDGAACGKPARFEDLRRQRERERR
ncbi:NAD-dependent epimerase/dehydratase family protein [Actinoplanes palleronii]|uniref:NAD-dependent epimerase/dehydratase domain-containing protein n=1 Tax=Actinoplanes palleronii TaxID=113570 RepID=A0ABQ4BN96_9ACTN|nr:NAD-dependent epimerase/dehydratase family protein [Actinoplanes palleronii]GIE72142.1 hypothetical protein Apa02nite_082500 [Actinoplanes palleronii]